MRMSKPLSTWCGVIVLVLAVLPTVVVAQQPPPGFVTMKPGETAQEVLPATPLVFAAYAFIWLVLLGYVFLLWRRIGRVERELADLVVGRKPAPSRVEGAETR